MALDFVHAVPVELLIGMDKFCRKEVAEFHVEKELKK